MYISANKVNITHSYTPARIDINQHSWASRRGKRLQMNNTSSREKSSSPRTEGPNNEWERAGCGVHRFIFQAKNLFTSQKIHVYVSKNLFFLRLTPTKRKEKQSKQSRSKTHSQTIIKLHVNSLPKGILNITMTYLFP